MDEKDQIDPLPRTYHTCPTMMKLVTIIPYLKNKPFDLSWNQPFFHLKLAIFVILRNTNKDFKCCFKGMVVTLIMSEDLATLSLFKVNLF